MPNGQESGHESPGVIARQLTGDLWCIGCGYNLRGLSIRELCPECAMPVRATILGVIDPKAHELTPLKRPRMVGLGLIAWASGLWIATMAVGNIYEADHVNSILMAGRADLVAIARPHLADPYWTLHAATAIGDRHEAWPDPYLPGRDQAWRLADKAEQMVEKV